MLSCGVNVTNSGYKNREMKTKSLLTKISIARNKTGCQVIRYESSSKRIRVSLKSKQQQELIQLCRTGIQTQETKNIVT